MTVRRAVDVAAAAVGLVLFAPLIALVALFQRVTLGAPVLFAQRRAGLGGVAFRMWKFRTMTDARDAAGRPLPDAMRLTPAGRLLRRTRLDELPQLWHVLAGDMSLVGPRPLLPETVAAAGVAGLVRARIRPGITGWAQVNGNTLLTDAEKLALDAWYVRNRSLALDMDIAARTVRVALLGERRDPQAIGRAHARGHRRGG